MNRRFSIYFPDASRAYARAKSAENRGGIDKNYCQNSPPVKRRALIKKPMNTRHKKFAQLVAGGMVAAEAYKKAGYKSKGGGDRANAARLIANDNIAASKGEATRVENEARERTRRIREDNRRLIGIQRAAFGKADEAMDRSPLAIISDAATTDELAAAMSAVLGPQQGQRPADAGIQQPVERSRKRTFLRKIILWQIAYH